MANLDRLGWAAGIAFRAYGLDLGVRVNDPRVLGRVTEALPHGWRPAKKPDVEHMFSLVAAPDAAERTSARMRRFHMLYSEGERLVRTLDLDELFDIFESSVRLLVAEHSRTRVFVHAGVVGWRGRAVVIPGRSYSGKSTLVAELVRAGATYYSDEYAVIDARGRVHPFLKPLSLREPGGFEQTETEVEAIGGSAGTKPLPIGCVVSTSFRPDARWSPRRMTPGKAALALFENTVSARRAPRMALEAFRVALTDAEAFKGPRGEASSVAADLLNRI